MRDHTQLEVFRLADALVVDVYRTTGMLPPEERYGLQAQLRRAAVSIPTNIVEGCARRTTREYLQFLNIALGSASEVRYLLQLAVRLELLAEAPVVSIADRYGRLVRAMSSLISSNLRRASA